MMKEKRKILLKYALGILFLVISVILAWFLPGWYGKWQDAQLMRQVQLTSRENIDFLDTNSLDIADRLKALQNTELFSWDNNMFFNTADESELIEKCQKQIALWCENGLLPEHCSEWTQEEYLYFLLRYSIYLDQTILSVCVLTFFVEGESCLTVVMDIEKDLVYYASASGPYVRDEMAKTLGYTSYQAIADYLSAVKSPLQQPIDVSGCDFAAVCGAENAQISKKDGRLELTALLQFDTFTGLAYRKVILNEWGFGIAVLYGTEYWCHFVAEVMAQNDKFEYLQDTEILIDDIASLSLREETEFPHP